MPRWTKESRQRQSELIRTWQPWTKSTGPRTAEGKAAIAMNNYRTGWYAENEGKIMLARWAKFDRHIRCILRRMKRARR